MLEKLCFDGETVTFLKDSTCTQLGMESLKILNQPTKLLSVNLFHLILDDTAFVFQVK